MTKNFHLSLLFPALLAFVLVLVSTRLYGAGLSTDSVHYIAVARNVAAGAGWVSFNGNVFVVQPPLYPLLLALVAIVFRVDPLAAAAFVNALLFGVIVYLTGLLFKNYLMSFGFILLGVIVVLFSPALIQVSIMAWSEPLFIFLTLIFLLSQQEFLDKRSARSFVLFTVSAAFASLTRYIGVTLILTGALAILVLLRARWRVKARDAVLFLLLASLPLVLWMARNYFVSSTFFGGRAPSQFSLGENIWFTANVLSSWFFIETILTRRIFVLAAIVCVGGIAVFVMARAAPRGQNFFTRVGGILLFIFIYLAFLIASATTTAFDRIDDRLLSPLVVPLILLFCLFLEKFCRTLRATFSNQWAAGIPIALVALWLLANAFGVTFRDLQVRLSEGAGGYNRRLWRESAIVRYLAQHPLDAERAAYTNAADAYYILLNQRARVVPSKTPYNSNNQANELAHLAETWRVENKSYLVWFDNVRRAYLFNLDELRTVVDAREIVRVNDGAVFEISRRISTNDQ